MGDGKYHGTYLAAIVLNYYCGRFCPGSYFAEDNLFLFISSLMYVFDIGRATDENGEEIIPEVIVDLTPTIVS